MNNSLSPYDMAGSMATYPHTAHRTSRSSTSQSGCHPYRVEKPKSNHNSPRTVERRKTTTGAKLYATLDDHYNMMMGITGDEDVVESAPEPVTTRPMSWHPSSTHFNARHTPATFDPSQNWPHQHSTSSRTSAHGSDFYSLSSRNSMCVDNSQQYQSHTNGFAAHRGSQDSDSSWQTQQSYAASSYSTPAMETMPWYLQEWARKNQDQAVVSQNGSAEFLPIQHPTTEAEDEQADDAMEDSGKELVGMGLYDDPDSSLDWGTSVGEATGKGLKLEETWQPPEEEEEEEEDDEDDEDEDQDDEASSDDGEEELPPPPAPMAPVNAKAHPAGNLEGQSFFFEEDDTVTKEWWYQHLKQPSMPVRDAGYGYGWL